MPIPQDSLFCQHCGTQVIYPENPAPTVQYSTPTNSNADLSRVLPTRTDFLLPNLLLGLFLYSVFSFFGAIIAGSLYPAQPQHYQSGLIILIMICFLILCMSTERTKLNIGLRIGYVVLAWLGQSFTTQIVALIWHIMDDSVSLFIAGFPWILYGMYRSRLFTHSYKLKA